MKKLAVLALIVAMAVAGIFYGVPRSYEPKAVRSTGAIFIGADRRFDCSGTEIGHTPEGDGVFLTARHCVANPDTNEINKDIVVSFSPNEGGPFYDAAPIAASLTDDIALLLIRDGADVPEIRIRDERHLKNGDPIFNVSFPLGTGKQIFHGEFMRANFQALPAEIEQYPQWLYSMPMNMTIAHGSSGSGVFSNKDQALIGVAVGTFDEGSYNIAIPASRVIYFLNHLQDNTMAKFVEANPVREAPFGWF